MLNTLLMGASASTKVSGFGLAKLLSEVGRMQMNKAEVKEHSRWDGSQSDVA